MILSGLFEQQRRFSLNFRLTFVGELMNKKNTVFLLFILLFFKANADIKDSIKYYIKNSKPELFGGMSSRNTFISSNTTSVTGVSAGYDYGGKIRLVAGVYWLAKPFVVRKTINKHTPMAYAVDESSRFWYLGLTGDYVFYKQGRWTLDVPVRIGFGSAKIKEFDITTEKLLNQKTAFIVPIETGIGALYKITWWVGVSGGLGSRIVIGKNNSPKFSGTYYNLGISIFFGEIYNRIAKDIKRDPLKELKDKVKS